MHPPYLAGCKRNVGWNLCVKNRCAIKNFLNSNTGLIDSYIDNKERKVLVSLEYAPQDNVRLKTMCAAQFHRFCSRVRAGHSGAVRIENAV
jgi:hypothetical protein